MITLRNTEELIVGDFKRYIIPGDPVPLARARMCGRSNYMFDSQKAIKLAWGIHLANQHQGPMWEGALHIDMTFFVYAPQIGRAKLLGQYCHKRPDLDNMIKFVLDASQTIIYNEDNCVASVIAKKIYDLNPRTEIIVCKL
jgi:Holliday junction resolvase RusA-like endonuclease